jgi:hypothetical protein
LSNTAFVCDKPKMKVEVLLSLLTAVMGQWTRTVNPNTAVKVGPCFPVFHSFRFVV